MDSFLDFVLVDGNKSLLMVKEYIPQDQSLPSESDISRVRDRPLAVVVDKWFAENTYHAREFTNFERLLELKEDQKVSISLGLPALNEEETVGNVIQTVKSALMDQVPLIDETLDLRIKPERSLLILEFLYIFTKRRFQIWVPFKVKGRLCGKACISFQEILLPG
jgi:hypothetical protein